MKSADPHRATQPGTAGLPPVHDDVAFDSTDVTSRSVLGFLAYLGLALGAALLVVWWSLALIESRIARSDRPPSPFRQSAKQQAPPEPILQGVPAHPSDAQEDLREYLRESKKELESYGWVDEKAGIARIPIEDAMQLIAKNGLPFQGGKLAANLPEKKKK